MTLRKVIREGKAERSNSVCLKVIHETYLVISDLNLDLSLFTSSLFSHQRLCGTIMLLLIYSCLQKKEVKHHIPRLPVESETKVRDYKNRKPIKIMSVSENGQIRMHTAQIWLRHDLFLQNWSIRGGLMLFLSVKSCPTEEQNPLTNYCAVHICYGYRLGWKHAWWQSPASCQKGHPCQHCIITCNGFDLKCCPAVSSIIPCTRANSSSISLE